MSMGRLVDACAVLVRRAFDAHVRSLRNACFDLCLVNYSPLVNEEFLKACSLDAKSFMKFFCLLRPDSFASLIYKYASLLYLIATKKLVCLDYCNLINAF